MLPFYAFESTENLPMSCVLLAFIAGTVGISLTNGGIGSYPLLVGLVVGFFLLDKTTDEFVINSPTITSTKMWPGDLGRYTSHALIFDRVFAYEHLVSRLCSSA